MFIAKAIPTMSKLRSAVAVYKYLVTKHLFLAGMLLAFAVVLSAISDLRVSALAVPETNRSAPQQTVPDFSKFKHQNPQHARLPCLLCHRRENNSARPTLPGRSGHAPCAGCHAQQFNGSSGPICSICHTNIQAGTVKPFPQLRSFNVKFDHARHSAAGAGCATCHRQNRGGVALSIPAGLSAHTVCFSCHTPQAQSNGRNISSCSTCHELGRLARTSERAAAFRVGFSHAKHDASENLRCADCHRVRAGLPMGRQVMSPVALNHHAPERTASCGTCHNGKKAFGGDDFSTCTRCHTRTAWHF
jgi:c(7)-type cytochrome triheme protein